MKLIVTGNERAHCLAGLLPVESWEKGLATMAPGSVRNGKETFEVEVQGLTQGAAIALIEEVWKQHPRAEGNTWLSNPAAEAEGICSSPGGVRVRPA